MPEAKVAIVTGGSLGIGRACVERLIADGLKVVIGDIRIDEARALATALGSNAYACPVDVADEASIEALVAETVARFGRLDVMVNNAGIVQVKPAIEVELAEWRRLFAVNLDGVFLGSRAAARQMIRQEPWSERFGGAIINASSTAARRPGPSYSAYCASKAAVMLFSGALAMELAPYKIRVNCTAPGFIGTAMWDDLARGTASVTGRAAGDIIDEFSAKVPWGRFGRPDEVAAVVSWLAGDDAEYVNGQAISMNGGEMLF
jgi:NAD(P)-dependent dehydrogenase (short-subunit alcohol dehydrogenase family)